MRYCIIPYSNMEYVESLAVSPDSKTTTTQAQKKKGPSRMLGR